MKIKIESVTNKADEATVLQIRRQVFEREMGITLTRPEGFDSSGALHLLARAEPNGDPIAAMSVVDTTGNDELHQSYELKFDPGLRVARYTQLAVLRSYRGMNIPLMLILEGHRQFVLSNQFHYTWLLFDAERAASSLMCRLLAFTPSDCSYLSEYGRSRALVRDERAPGSKQAIQQAQQYLDQFLNAFSPADLSLAYPACTAQKA
jgi:hypothetical protein